MKTLKSIDMNSSQLKNVAAPSTDTDAANKSYVDTQIATVTNNITADNLTIIDEGTYYQLDWVDNGGSITVVDQGSYVTLSIN